MDKHARPAGALAQRRGPAEDEDILGVGEPKLPGPIDSREPAMEAPGERVFED